MIYLDHHAAAPTPEVVRQAMADASSIAWANPSSTHRAGQASRQLLENARELIGQSIGAAPADVVLTGGGTEACNLGVRGLAKKRRIITTAVEHPAVAESVRHLARDGREVLVLPVLAGRPPAPSELAPHLSDDSLVTVQWVNHETGTLFPVHDYAQLCRARGARLFVDATQALGKVPIDVSSLGADAVAFAAQKIGGPAGAGACWVRRGIELDTVLAGGSQERGRRPGTLDTLSMVGFGAAASLIGLRLERKTIIAALRNRLEARLLALGAVPNAGEPRSATVCNVSFPRWEGAILVAALDLEGVCVSTGAACSSGLQEPSAVIRAMYPDEQWRAGSAVRISLGIETTEQDIESATLVFQQVLSRIKGRNLHQI
ncbi:MAG: cysteine desulfurase [Myxococcales bacterium]|nr:cysteine desulfurase [Myxococcales bacterium]MDH3484473.1 cysteine desulfurase [Myxococcales bacterium]